MKAFVIAIIAYISVSTCKVEGADHCTTIYPICGEGSKLCPHDMCAKPDGGKCNRDGDGCLDIRWNRDACLVLENTCGNGATYCGTPPDFTDCSCDNGVCIAIGPQNTFAPTSSSPTKSPSNSPAASPSQSPSKSPTNAPSASTNEPTVASNDPTVSMASLPTTAPASSASFLPSISSGPTLSMKFSEMPSISLAPSISARPTDAGFSIKPSFSEVPSPQTSGMPSSSSQPSMSLSPASGGSALLDMYSTYILLFVGSVLILI